MSSEVSSDEESCVSFEGIGSHGRGWRKRRYEIEAELDAAHDIKNFRVKVHTPGCLPQWQSGPLVVPRLRATSVASLQPLPYSETLLGKLPAELRLKIYGHAFGCPDRPISIRKRLLSHEEALKILPFECKQPAPHSHYYHDCWDGRLLASGDEPLISLLLTCRQAYQETIELLYSHRTLSFHNIECLSRFLDRTPRSHLENIRSLCISTQIHYTPTSSTMMAFDASFANIGDTKLWKSVCRTLGTLEELRSLRLYIAKGRYSLWASMEYQLSLTLGMLTAVQHVPDYVIVFAASDDVKDRFIDAPFRLKDSGTATDDAKACEGCLDCLREA